MHNQEDNHFIQPVSFLNQLLASGLPLNLPKKSFIDTLKQLVFKNQ